MFCKQTQNTIDTLLRLKVDKDKDNDNDDSKSDNKPTINLIGSYEDSVTIPGMKIASVKSKTGELVGFIGLLKGLTH